MANTNAQAIFWVSNKLRPLADKMGGLYNLSKALQAEYIAEGASALFPNDAQTISDGSDLDGRSVLANADIVTFINVVGAFITLMEQTSNANRNNVLKIAVNPQNY